MRFAITGSAIETMNGEYEVLETGLVCNLTQRKIFKPAIDHVVKWMCDEAGESGLIWIGLDFCALGPRNESHIMNTLGFRDWPACVLRAMETS